MEQSCLGSSEVSERKVPQPLTKMETVTPPSTSPLADTETDTAVMGCPSMNVDSLTCLSTWVPVDGAVPKAVEPFGGRASLEE